MKCTLTARLLVVGASLAVTALAAATALLSAPTVAAGHLPQASYEAAVSSFASLRDPSAQTPTAKPRFANVDAGVDGISCGTNPKSECPTWMDDR